MWRNTAGFSPGRIPWQKPRRTKLRIEDLRESWPSNGGEKRIAGTRFGLPPRTSCGVSVVVSTSSWKNRLDDRRQYRLGSSRDARRTGLLRDTNPSNSAETSRAWLPYGLVSAACGP